MSKIFLEIKNKKFIIDKNSCSIFFENIDINKNNKILNLKILFIFLKQLKKQEIENIKKAHIYDGVALTKYLFWLKKNFYKKKLLK